MKGKPESTVALVSLRGEISPAALEEYLEGALGKGKVEVVELAGPGAPSENTQYPRVSDRVGVSPAVIRKQPRQRENAAVFHKVTIHPGVGEGAARFVVNADGTIGLLDPSKVLRLPAPVVVSDLLGYTGKVKVYYTGKVMDTAAAFAAAARTFSDRELKEYIERGELAAAVLRERETTSRATATPRLKWEADRLPDENPATFAWRAYAAEAKAGTLHRGLIGQEDKALAVKLSNWLRTHDMPEGIDIPTKPEWDTRQLASGKAKPEAAPRTQGQRLYDVERGRRRRAAAKQDHPAF
jgi:hypothetical protein